MQLPDSIVSEIHRMSDEDLRALGRLCDLNDTPLDAGICEEIRRELARRMEEEAA